MKRSAASPTGFENSPSFPGEPERCGPAENPPDDGQAIETRRDPSEALGQSVGNGDPIEAALVVMLRDATERGNWDEVTEYARKLDARRSDREADVFDLAAERERRASRR